MDNSGDNWWPWVLGEHRKDGRKDAEIGRFIEPYPAADDHNPPELDENQAYKDGFMERRHELGDKFKWE